MKTNQFNSINAESASCHVTMTDYLLYSRESHLCIDDDCVVNRRIECDILK